METQTNARILVVDDEQVIRDLFKRFLEGNAYEVLLASNGSEGLRIFQENQNKIDLIILDMKMPGGMRGEEVLAQIRQKSQVKVLVCSGFFPPDQVAVLQQLGISGIINKPCSPGEFMHMVATVLQP